MNNSPILKSIAKFSALSVGTYLLGKTIIRSLNRFNLQNKVVLITGGSRGLGLILARRMAIEGANVVICGRSEDSLKRAYKDLPFKSTNILAIPCDISDKQQINQMMSRIKEEMGTVDILINNAGVIQVGPMDLMNEEDFKSVMNVHFWGPFHLMNEVLPDMKRKKFGRIVNITSIGSILSFPHLLPYNASKHALSGLSEGISGELKHYNIKVTTVYPGMMRTGSPRNIDVKGQHKKEYAWFKLFDSLPLLSMNADKAASKIVDAMKKGDKSLTLTFPAKFIKAVHAIAPELTLNTIDLINNFLPAKPDRLDKRVSQKGYESESKLSQSVLTKKTEKAAEKNLEKQN